MKNLIGKALCYLFDHKLGDPIEWNFPDEWEPEDVFTREWITCDHRVHVCRRCGTHVWKMDAIPNPFFDREALE